MRATPALTPRYAGTVFTGVMAKLGAWRTGVNYHVLISTPPRGHSQHLLSDLLWLNYAQSEERLLNKTGRNRLCLHPCLPNFGAIGTNTSAKVATQTKF